MRRHSPRTRTSQSRSAAAGPTPISSSNALGDALNRIPEHLPQTRRFKLGVYRGLEFGIERDPDGTADVYLAGAADRKGFLTRESQGSRAVLNALGRLADSHGEASAKAQTELAVSRNRLRDFEARLGLPFAQAERLDALAGLRDRLKQSLSARPANAPDGADDPHPEATAAAIKVLLANPMPDGGAARRLGTSHRGTATNASRLRRLSDEGPSP